MWVICPCGATLPPSTRSLWTHVTHVWVPCCHWGLLNVPCVDTCNTHVGHVLPRCAVIGCGLYPHGGRHLEWVVPMAAAILGVLGVLWQPPSWLGPSWAGSCPQWRPPCCLRAAPWGPPSWGGVKPLWRPPSCLGPCQAGSCPHGAPVVPPWCLWGSQTRWAP